jgi:uncharacterized protein (TIGR02996 family)
MALNDEFLQAIIDEPDDHARRFAYADYLEDQGHVALSDLVRLLCRRATLPPTHPEQATLKVREQTLLADAIGPLLRRRVSEFLQAATPGRIDVRPIAKRHMILPLLTDGGGCCASRMDGRLVVFLWDTPDELRAEDDPRIRNLCLFHGGSTYPELRVLLPPRPTGSPACPHCESTNKFRLTVPNLVCYCGGLGWLPPDGW